MNYTVIKGDSTPIRQVSVKNYPSLDGYWKCDIRVYSKPDIFIINKVADKESAQFKVYLTPEEIDKLPIGVYTWEYVVYNNNISPVFKRTVRRRLEVV